MPTTRIIEPGFLLSADLCGVKHRYHGNVLRGYFVGDPPSALVDIYDRAGAAIAFAQSRFKAGMTVGEVNDEFKAYCERSGLSDEGGWILGYKLGLSLPPDWVGDFFFNMLDTEYLDRVFEPNMVTNLEVLYGTSLIDTFFWRADFIENPTTTPCKLLTLPA